MPNRYFLVLLLSWWVVRAALSSQAATTTPGKRGSLWRTWLSETFPYHLDSTGLAQSLFFRMALCSYAVKRPLERLGGSGLAFISSQSPGRRFLARSLPNHGRSYLCPSQTRHASTPRTPRRFPRWLHIGSRCSLAKNTLAQFPLFPHSRHAGGYWRCSGLPRNPFSTPAFTKGHFTLCMPEEAARKIVCFPVSRSMAFTNSFPSPPVVAAPLVFEHGSKEADCFSVRVLVEQSLCCHSALLPVVFGFREGKAHHLFKPYHH